MRTPAASEKANHAFSPTGEAPGKPASPRNNVVTARTPVDSKGLSTTEIPPKSDAAELNALSGACLDWMGHIHSRTGYGITYLDGHTEGAHRAAWMKAHGRIPDGLHVLHACDNRRCVNVEHLRLGTNADNVRDRQGRGRQAKGLRHGKAKLSDASVEIIRAQVAQGMAQKDVARLHGVSRSLVSFIINGKRRAS